jgi:SNF2 family DNA or RNA helicase
MVIVNYELVSRNKMAFVDIMRQTPSGLIVDEGHRLKNPEADRTRAIMAMAMFAPWRLVLTGSLVLQGAQDVWAPWMVVDRGLTFGANYVSFRDEWLQENAWTGKLTLKPGQATQVGQRLRRRGVRLRKEDCMDLPPKTFEAQMVQMSAEQWEAYEAMGEELLAELEEDEEATAATQLVALLRLTQITSGFLPTTDGTVYHFAPNPKLEVLREVVQDIRAEDQAVLVWARYREDVTAIATVLRSDGHRIGTIMGARTAADRVNNREIEERFERGDFDVLIGIPEAGGLGLNLQRASYAVYYSQGYSLEGRQQSEDRCHRAGSEVHAKVTYIDLMCEGTIDEEVLAALRDKKAVQEAVVDLRSAVRRVILARAVSS